MIRISILICDFSSINDDVQHNFRSVHRILLLVSHWDRLVYRLLVELMMHVNPLKEKTKKFLVLMIFEIDAKLNEIEFI